MDRRLVVGIVIDTLDDVDLAGLWPSRAVRPESGPGTTTSGHVDAVHDDEPTGEAVLRLNAHGIAISGHLGRGIDSHDRVPGTIDGREVARLLSGRRKVMRHKATDKSRQHTHRRRLIYILHISIRGVGTRKEVPSREKRVPGLRKHITETIVSTARSIIIGQLRFFFARRGLNGCLGGLGHACRVLLGRGNHLHNPDLVGTKGIMVL